MPSVLETLSLVALDENVVTALQSDMTGLVGRAGGLPVDAIANAISMAGKIALPDEQALFGQGASGLASLASGGLKSPDEMWLAVTNPLSSLESMITSGIQGPITSGFSQLNQISNSAPMDAAALLGELITPLQQVVGLLGDSPEIQRLQEFITKIKEIQVQLEAAPTELANLLRDQIQNALTEATALISPVIGQLESYISKLETQVQIENLQQQYEAMLFKLVPENTASLADSIANLDFSSIDDVAVIDGKLRTALAMAQNLVTDTRNGMGQAIELLPIFNSDAWLQRMVSAAELSSSGQIDDISKILQQWQEKLVEAQDIVASLSLDHALQPIQAVVDQMQPAIEAFNVDDIKDQLIQGIQSSSTLVDSVNQAQIDILATFQSLANTIKSAIEAVNLDMVTPTVTNALAAIDPLLSEIETQIDSIATESQNALGQLDSELTALHTKLTDPAGDYRKPIEDFFVSVRDAVPDDIPAQLEAAGEKLGEAVAGLDNITFDPVFDDVVAELERMRDELQQIDAESLSPLLQGALATALAAFKTFDFQGQVDDVLIDKFDTAIAFIDEDAVGLLQDQIDQILNYIRRNNPSELFEKLGVSAAYDDMVDQLNDFQPSQGLSGVVDAVNDSMNRLEAFTPSQILKPVIEPMEELKNFTQTISLDPAFAQLENSLTALNDLMTQLDIAPFVQDLSNAVAQVRQQVSDTLTVDGLLDSLQPVHQALADALTALDPAAILQPIEDVRDVLLDAIDAVDVSQLSDTFTGITAMMNGFALPDLRTDLAGKVHALTASVNSFDLPAKFNELQSIQQQIKTAIEDCGVQLDADAENRRQALLYSINALEPLPLMAEALIQYRSFQASMGGITAEIDALLQDGGELENPLQKLTEHLQQIGPAIDNGAADVKQALRDIINQAFEASGIDGIQAIYTELQATVDSYSPANIETAIDAMIAPLADALDSLADPTAIFDEVIDSFNDLKAIVDPGLSDFLDNLKTQLQPLVDSIIAQVDAVDLTAAIGELDVKYAEIMLLKDSLQGKLDGLLSSVDAPYQQIVGIVDDLNPGDILVEPLSVTYDEILAKIEGVSIRVVFEPLFAALKKLRDALLEGIRRSGDAFESFLSAAPPLNSGVSI